MSASPAPSRRFRMTVNMALRAMAGFFILLSLALGHWVHEGFYLFTAFVGANLLQSGFSDSCPAMWIFRKLGLPDGGDACGTAAK